MHDTNKDGSTALLFHRHLLFLLIGIIEPNYGKMAPASRRKKCEQVSILMMILTRDWVGLDRQLPKLTLPPLRSTLKLRLLLPLLSMLKMCWTCSRTSRNPSTNQNSKFIEQVNVLDGIHYQQVYMNTTNLTKWFCLYNKHLFYIRKRVCFHCIACLIDQLQSFA